MCNPVAVGIAGLALSAAGTVYQAQQNANYVKRQNDANTQKAQLSALAQSNERARQADFQKQADANLQAELTAQGAGKINSEIDAGTQQAAETTQTVQDQTGVNAGLLPGQNAGPTNTANVGEVFSKEAAAATARRMEQAKTRMAALATLSGFDRANGYSRITGNRFAADQSLLQSQQRASLGLGQQEGNITQDAFVGSPSSLGSTVAGLGNAALAFAPNAKENFKSIGSIFSSPTG